MVRKTHRHEIAAFRKLVSYDARTGEFTWLPRSPEHFKSAKAYKAWKTRFEGQPAFLVCNGAGYKRSKIFGANYYAHRVAWAMHYNEWPEHDIDHINGNPSDNRIQNLRSVSHIENCRNAKRPSDNTSGVIGVSWVPSRKKWAAYIDDGIGRIPLGRYDELYQAVIARKAAEAALRYHPNHGRD